MDLVESNFQLLACGEPCLYHHPPTPMWTGKSINPTCILHTLVRIMKDPISEDQVKRQLYLLCDLKMGLKFGFWVRDIENSMKLMEILLCKGECVSVFFEYAKYLLGLMRFAPLMCRTNEILEYGRDVQEYFDFFGYLLVTSPKLSVRQIIIDSLKILVNYEGAIKQHSMPVDMLKHQITLSNLPIILVKYMELCNNEVYCELLQIIATFTTFSTAMGIILLKAGCLQVIMMRLDPNWQKNIGGPRPEYNHLCVHPDCNLDDCIMLIHTLLNVYRNNPQDVADVSVPTVEALWGFRYAFHVYIQDVRFINERNFMAALCLRLAECFPDAMFVHAGIVQDVAVLSTIGDDTTMGGKWTATLRFKTQSVADFEFKRTMMMGLILFRNCLGVDQIYTKSCVLLPLCKILDKSTLWSSNYHRSLTLAALQVLNKIILSYVKSFLKMDGLKRLLNILEQWIQHSDFLACNSTYSLALTVLYKIIKSEMKHQHQIDIKHVREVLVDLIHYLFEMDFKLANQSLMTQALNVLGLLPFAECAAYVNFVVALLQRALHPRQTDKRYISRLFVSAIWLLWRYGVHSVEIFLYFIKLHGIYLLLDFLKDAEFSVQLICLGVLADIIEHEAAVSYFVTWQSDGVGIVALLMNLFHNECVRIGVDLLPRGVVADPKFPLMGTIQKAAYMNNIITPNISPAVTDIFYSCRPKIFAIMCLLNNRHGEVLDIVNEYYRTFEANLTIDHKITKLLCDHYLTIKIGETWLEGDLFAQQIGAVQPHKSMLETMLKYFYECGVNIQKLQNNWLIIERKNDHLEEEEFYNLLRESKLSGAIRALKEIMFLARCNNPKFRISDNKSEWKNIHRTQLLNNFVSSQRIVLQSDIILDPFAPKPPLVVSSDSEDDITIYDAPMSDVSLPSLMNFDAMPCALIESDRKKKKKN